MNFLKYVVVLFIALNSSSLFSKTLVISDIDDTIKMTNSMGKWGQVRNFLKNKPFIYTRDLYNELQQNFEDQNIEHEFIYVSAAPDWIFNQQKFLKKYDFPFGRSYLKKLDSPETYIYKFNTIKTILDAYHTTKTVYFFGDNSSHDHQVYFDIRKAYPQIEFKIFIRDVRTDATYWSDEFEVNKLSNIYYFFSERDLLDNQELSFISSKLRKNIEDAYSEQVLVPSYTRKTLYERVLDVRGCTRYDFSCKESAEVDVKNFWTGYYLKY